MIRNNANNVLIRQCHIMVKMRNRCMYTYRALAVAAESIYTILYYVHGIRHLHDVLSY